MKRETVQYSLRIDRQLLQKLRYLAKTEKRFLNREIEYLLHQCITQLEKENGPIPLDPPK